MERLISNMMKTYDISCRRLETENEIRLPEGRVLDWNYYRFVKDNPVSFEWKSPVSILYGSKDNITELEDVTAFSSKNGAQVTVAEGGEHFFHTEEQLRIFELWTKQELRHSD